MTQADYPGETLLVQATRSRGIKPPGGGDQRLNHPEVGREESNKHDRRVENPTEQGSRAPCHLPPAPAQSSLPVAVG